MSGAFILINQCLRIKKGEKALIVTDKETLDIAESLEAETKKAGANPHIYMIEETRRPITEIPKDLKDLIKDASVGMTPFRAIALEGTFRFNLVQAMASSGAKVAHMPGITSAIMTGPALDNVDFSIIETHAQNIKKALAGRKKIHITAHNGTDLTFNISGRKIVPESCIIKKGEISNFPGGEVFLSPLEDSANGTYTCDISCGDAGKVDSPITLNFKDGRLTSLISKGKSKDIVQKDIKEATGSKDTLCEFGIGINPFFRPRGNALTDEKILGTCHIAIGDNTGLGGINSSSIHIDFIMDKPTIIADKTTIMKEGKLNV